MDYFTHYTDHTGTRQDKHYKTTMFQGESLMVGLNCLEPGQVQPVHDHADQDKMYAVMQGRGWFTVGGKAGEAGPGTVIFAPAGVPHGVENRADERLVLLVNIAPPPAPKA
jgi:quercetin dioxygenase-like cupin family protein